MRSPLTFYRKIVALPELSIKTVRRLIKDMERRNLIVLLPGDPSEQTHRVALSPDVSKTVNAAIEARYQRAQARKSMA